MKQINQVIAVLSTSFALGACAGDEMLDGETLVPGDLVERNGLVAVAPEPGESMQVTAIMLDGSSRELAVDTLEDGTVNVIERSVFDDEPVAGDGTVEILAGGPPPACRDEFWVGFVYRWRDTYNWRFNAGTTPRALSKNNVEDAIVRGTKNVTTSHNDCGMGDRVGATQDYRGRTDRRACTMDGVNVTDFGDLPAGVLAVTCTRASGTRALESDMRLNKDDYHWFVNKPDDCRRRYSIEAVTTHERGHTFGLADLSVENHGNLTMAGRIGDCVEKARTLGKGDILGLRNKY